MRRRRMIKVSTRPNSAQSQKVNLTVSSARKVIPVGQHNLQQDIDKQKKASTTERYLQNIKATEHIDGDIVIYRNGNGNLPSFTTKRQIVHANNLSEVKSERISFIYLDLKNTFEFSLFIDNVLPKLSWGCIIFIPTYYRGSNSVNVAWDQFIKNNFMITYTSRQKYFNPHKPKEIEKEEYLAIKYLNNPQPVKRSNKRLKIATVWKRGALYDSGYVTSIYKACKKYVNVDFDFYCLTDFDGDFEISEINKIPLIHDWKGYWSKMELFRKDIFPNDDVFYLDLDTLLTSDITDIATIDTIFFGMRDFNMLNELSSGVLKFKSKYNHYLYETFLQNPTHWMKCRGGDQEAIRKILKMTPDFMQDIFPRRMAEFKNHCWNDKTKTVSIPNNYSIVCFHSSPKMHDIKDDPIIKKYWLR